MSNHTVMQRLHAIVDQSELQIGSQESFEWVVVDHMRALEGVSFQEIELARELASDIRFAHYFEDGEEHGEPASAVKARDEFRAFLDDLEGRIGLI